MQFPISLILTAGLSVLLFKAVREDNASGKIRNALIAAGLAGVAVALLLLAVQTAFHESPFGSQIGMHQALPTGYFTKYVYHGLAVLLAAVGLWKIGTWPAGDAKLYILVSFAIPVIIPTVEYFPGLLFLSVLINIFVPAGICFMAQAAITAGRHQFDEGRGDIYAIIRLGTRNLTRNLADAAKNPGAMAPFLLLTIIFGAVRFLKTSYSWGQQISEPMFFIFMMLLWPAIGFLFTAAKNRGTHKPQNSPRSAELSPLLMPAGNGVLWAIGICIVLSSLHPLGRLILTNAAYGLTRSLPFIILNKAIDELMGRDGKIIVNGDSLHEGTILTDEYLCKIKSTAPDFYAEHFSTAYPDGLTEKQAEQLNIFIHSYNTPELKLHQIATRAGRPFAGWIAAGAFLTVTLHGETVIHLCQYAIQLLKE